MATVCQDCPRIIPNGTRSGRCPTHERARDRARGTRQERGYGTQHQRIRAAYAAHQDAGHTLTCWRCGQPITGAWDLGHDDHDRSTYRGPEHPACNRATSTRKAVGPDR